MLFGKPSAIAARNAGSALDVPSRLDDRKPSRSVSCRFAPGHEDVSLESRICLNGDLPAATADSPPPPPAQIMILPGTGTTAPAIVTVVKSFDVNKLYTDTLPIQFISQISTGMPIGAMIVVDGTLTCVSIADRTVSAADVYGPTYVPTEKIILDEPLIFGSQEPNYVDALIEDGLLPADIYDVTSTPIGDLSQSIQDFLRSVYQEAWNIYNSNHTS